MNRWKWDKSWILVWGSSLLVGGLILYNGHQSILYESSQEKAQATKTVQTVSAKIPASVPLPKSSIEGQKISEEQQSSLKKADFPAKKLTIKDFHSPVQGELFRDVGNYYSEVLDNYLFHAGIDYAEPEGAIIRATQGGKVVFAGKDLILGQKVTLDCGEGWLVTYGGLDNLNINSGDTIETGEKIGQVGFYSGAEGSSNRPRLHYEVWHGNEVQRP